MTILENKTILITGGTGSFGQNLIKKLLMAKKKPKKIIVYSRDEFKQYEMKKKFSEFTFKGMRYFIGDIRDKERLYRATEGVNIIIHAAALKQVDTAEENPMEVIKTNIFGAQNIIDCSLDSGVENIIALSTDKASSPINLYGATKLCSDKLFLSANNIRGSKNIKFSVVRYGNVLGSRGSVLPVFLNTKNNPFFTLTHPEMTRFNITLDEGVDFVIYSLSINKGGEIFVPKIPSFKIVDLAKAIKENAKFKTIGIRKGEKIHEELISAAESNYTVENKNSYIILGNHNLDQIHDYIKKTDYKRVLSNFSYKSNSNKFALDINQLKKIIKKNI